MLSDYRLSKSRRVHGEENAAAGLLLDYALRPYGLRERDMRYGENSCGKPYFIDRPDIHFNLSHSGGYAVCAVSDREVGIDVQAYEDFKDVLEIARRYFTAAEYEYVKNANTAFFPLWTRKESLLKALGTGLSGGLSAYETLRDSVTVGNTEFYFSYFDLDVAVTVCSPEKASEIVYVTEEMLKSR